MELEKIVMKLVGPVEAIGESNADRERLENLKTLTDLIDRLLSRVMVCTVTANRHEDSMMKIGMFAKNYLQEVRDDLPAR